MKRRMPRLKGRRGQAMVNYAIITFFILGGLTGLSMIILPQMLDALDAFTASMYFCVNMPLP
ncbi:MAG: hypothetical protein GYA21_18855 [Myxococcales bacterium]|nr:hypothetical protein [Myxococcales bacterium]